MDTGNTILIGLKRYGTGRRKLDDNLFISDKPLPRLGIWDVDDENFCHEIIKAACSVPGCQFEAESLLEFENHYNASHRYSCSQCKKVLPSPHLLDLHIQETHDSYFAVMAAKKPSYCCYIEECKEKFMNADERLEHCVKIHKIPKDFRFDQKPKKHKGKTKSTKVSETSMEIDKDTNKDKKIKKISLSNNKQKSFTKYTGRKFTTNEKEKSSTLNMDKIMHDLKENLPS